MIAPSLLLARRVARRAPLARSAHSTADNGVASHFGERAPGLSQLADATAAARAATEAPQTVPVGGALVLSPKDGSGRNGYFTGRSRDSDRKLHVASSKEYRAARKGGYIDQIVGAVCAAEVQHVLSKLEAKRCHAERFHYVRAIERLGELQVCTAAASGWELRGLSVAK